jgi:hypothetical protein
LNPLGQVETGFIVPAVGARTGTFFGGLVACVLTFLITSRARDIRSLNMPGAEVRRAPTP